MDSYIGTLSVSQVIRMGEVQHSSTWNNCPKQVMGYVHTSISYTRMTCHLRTRTTVKDIGCLVASKQYILSHIKKQKKQYVCYRAEYTTTCIVDILNFLHRQLSVLQYV